MRKISKDLLAQTIVSKRKAKGLGQIELGEMSGINRSMLSRMEHQTYIPTIEQLEVASFASKREL